MSDSGGMTLGLAIGLGIGAIALLVLLSRESQAAGVQPQMTVHNVARDEYGRIISVETMQGLGMGAPAAAPPPAARPQRGFSRQDGVTVQPASYRPPVSRQPDGVGEQHDYVRN